MFLDKNKILTSISKEDIIKICKYFGCNTYKQVGNGLGFSTYLCHKGDSPYKLVAYPPNHTQDKWRLHCFTCGDNYDLVELVMRAGRNQGKILTWYRSLLLIAQLTGHLFEKEKEDGSLFQAIDFSWIDRLSLIKNKKDEITYNLVPINENILQCFYYGADSLLSWISEGISPEALGRFEIGYATWTNQISIPHRDWRNDKLVGIRGRYMIEEDAEKFGKYMPIFINGKFLKHPLGSNFYGAWVTLDKIKELKKVLIVESEKSCLLAYTYFHEDSYCVAICGSNITKIQKFILLKEWGVNKIIYAPDRDYYSFNSFETESWYQKQIDKLKDFFNFCDVYLIMDQKDRLEYKDSPLDKGKELFLELYNEKIRIDKI